MFLLDKVKSFIFEEEGQGMTEYALILGVIAIGAIVAFGVFGDALIARINEVRTTIFGPGTE